jgi:hypothetical protein
VHHDGFRAKWGVLKGWKARDRGVGKTGRRAGGREGEDKDHQRRVCVVEGVNDSSSVVEGVNDSSSIRGLAGEASKGGRAKTQDNRR